MDRHSIIRLTELQTVYYCKRIFTMLLVVEELSKRIPDFESDAIREAKNELRKAEHAVEDHLIENPAIRGFSLQWHFS